MYTILSRNRRTAFKKATKNMGNIIGEIGAGMAMSVGGNIVNKVLNPNERENAMQDQKELMKQQYQYNKGLMQDSYSYQQGLYDHTYEKTKAASQVKNLKEAGLNPALMYAQGAGQGASTTTGGGSASVSGGSASGMAERQMANQQGVKMMLDAQMMQSQIKLANAEADNLDADTEKKKGIDTELAKGTLGKIIQETKNESTKNELLEIEKNIQSLSATSQIWLIDRQAEEAEERVRALEYQNDITLETKEDLIKEIKARAIGTQLNNDLTEEKKREISNNILQKWEQIKIGWGTLDNQQKETKIKEFTAEINSEYQGLLNVGGKIMDRGANATWYLLEKMQGREGNDWKSKN